MIGKKILLDFIQLVFLLPVVLIPGDKLVTTSQESFEEPNSQNGRFCFFIRCTSSIFWIGYVWCKLWCKVTCTSMIISVCKTSPLCINMLIFYCVHVHFPKFWNKIFDIKAELNLKKQGNCNTCDLNHDLSFFFSRIICDCQSLWSDFRTCAISVVQQ